MATATKATKIHTSPSARPYPFNANNHPTIETPAGNVSIDLQTDGFRPDYNMWPGCGNHHSYTAYLRFEDALKINGKTYDQLDAMGRGSQFESGEVYGFERALICDTTPAATKAVNDAIMPAFTAWIAEQGGLAELFKQARNRARIRHAAANEREAERQLTEAAKIRQQIEN